MFSSASTPSLHNVLLALERLHAVWEKASSKSWYLSFVPALNVGMAKLNQYYGHSSKLDAHILAMGTFPSLPYSLYWLEYCSVIVLNSKKKLAYFTKHWPADLVEEVESVVCECVSPSISICLCTLLMALIFSLKFVECYKVRIANEQDQVNHVCKVAAPPTKLGHWNIDNTDSSDDDEDYPRALSTGNYLEEWNLYLTTNKVVPDEIEIVGWWGVHWMLSCHDQSSHTFLVVWESLPYMEITCLQLSIIHGFVHLKQASIFFSWHHNMQAAQLPHNCLNTDIVEDLQCLKSLIHQD